MQQKENIQKELRELGIDIPKQSSEWSLPANYFEELEQNVLSKTVEQSTAPKTRLISLRMRRVLQVAATSLLLAGLAYFGLQRTTSEQIAFSQEDADIFIEENIEDFDDAWLIEYLTEYGAEPLFSTNELDIDQEFDTYFEENILDGLSEDELNTLL